MVEQLRRQLASRIRYSIILPYMVLAVALLVLLGALSFWIIANNLQDKLDQDLQKAALGTSISFEQIEAEALDTMRLVVSAPADATRALSSTADAFAAKDQAQIDELMRLTFEYYEVPRLLALNADGTVVTDLATRAVRERSASLVGNSALGTNPLIQAALNGVSDQYGDKYASLLQFNDGASAYTMLYVIAPIRASDANSEVVGGLIFAYPLDSVLEDIARTNGVSLLAILDGSGRTIVSFPPEARDFDLTPSQVGLLQEGGSLSTSLERNDLAFQVLYNPLRIRRTLDGYFITGLPRNAITNAWEQSRVMVALIAAIALVSVGVIGMRVTNRITKPLGELAETALHVKSGDLERRTEVNRTDELGTLASVLNEMTDRLLELYRTSRQLSTELALDGVLQHTSAAVARIVPHKRLTALLHQEDDWYHLVDQEYRPIDAPLSAAQLTQLPAIGNRASIPSTMEAIYAIAPQAEIIVPLRTQQQSIGLLIIETEAPVENLQALTEPLTAVVSMCATAMRNGLLYSTVQDEAVRKQAILQSIADGVVVLDNDRSIVLTNEAATTMLGYSQEELLQTAFDALPLQAVNTPSELFGLSANQVALYEINGRVVSMSAAPVHASTGEQSGQVVVIHDVTAERAMDRAKTEFIATISHELRTPLTSICGYSDLLLRGLVGPLEEEQLDFMRTIRTQAQSMVDLIQNVIMIASIEAGSMQPVMQPYSVASLVEHALQTQRKPIEDKKLVLNIDVPETLPYVLADRDHMRIILVQLLDNARRYTEQGSISIRAFAHEQAIQIDIRDTGRGIDQSDRERLFTRFKRGGEQSGLASRERGAGLGLAIARQLVESLRGTIDVTSVVGEGSTFSIQLPIASDTELRADEYDIATAA